MAATAGRRAPAPPISAVEYAVAAIAHSPYRSPLQPLLFRVETCPARPWYSVLLLSRAFQRSASATPLIFDAFAR